MQNVVSSRKIANDMHVLHLNFLEKLYYNVYVYMLYMYNILINNNGRVCKVLQDPRDLVFLCTC